MRRRASGAGSGGAGAELIADATEEIWNLLSTTPNAKARAATARGGAGVQGRQGVAGRGRHGTGSRPPRGRVAGLWASAGGRA